MFQRVWRTCPPFRLKPAKIASRESVRRVYAALSLSPSLRAEEGKQELRTQRVGILDHIRPAAGGRARGEQDETVGGKHPAREIAADGEVIRDVLARRIVEPRQRDMRGELAPLRIKADPLHQPLELRLQLDQRLARLDGGHH